MWVTSYPSVRTELVGREGTGFQKCHPGPQRGWFPGTDSAGCSSISAEPAGGASKPQEGIGTGSSAQSGVVSPFLLSLDLDFAPLLTAPSQESGLCPESPFGRLRSG